jgi:hypothetical protein
MSRLLQVLKVSANWPACLAAIALVVLLVDWTARRAVCEEQKLATNLQLTPAMPDQPITVRERLIVGLQARLQSEVDFIDEVLAQVQAGHLPQTLVDQAFFWARQRAAMPTYGRPQRPIIYFKPAMIARANALNVTL